MRTMVMIKLLVCTLLAFLLTLSSERIGLSSAIQLCQYGVDTTHLINLNMDSSEISGSSSMCSCRIQLIHDAELKLYPDMAVPGCSTSVSLSDSSFEFLCSNGKIEPPTSYTGQNTAEDVLWLLVTSTDGSQAMSGQLQIKTRSSSSQFKLECFDANTNTSVTTLIPTTTTTSTTTDTIITNPASSTPTKPDREGSSTMASRVNPSSTDKSDGSTVPTVSTSANIPPTDDTLIGDNKKKFPVAAVAGGIAGGLLLVLVVILACVCFRYRCVRRTTNDQIPESRDHPTYSDLTNRENTEYEHIDHNNATTRVYQNVALDIRE